MLQKCVYKNSKFVFQRKFKLMGIQGFKIYEAQDGFQLAGPRWIVGREKFPREIKCGVCTQPKYAIFIFCSQCRIGQGPQNEKLSDPQITLYPTGSIHKKAREKV